MARYYSTSEFVADPNTPWFKVLNLINNKSSVLDIGCSSGNFGAELIKQKSCVVDGVELDAEDVKLAKQKLRNVYTFNIENGAPDEFQGKYDVVYYGDVIEHLINPVKALENTKRLLTDNGVVIFSIPNMAHMSVRLMLLEGGFEYGEAGILDNTHLHYYTLREIERVFANSGYAINKIDWVQRDIPVEILDKRLSDLGLTANEKFYKLNSGVEASAYQYIGLARPSKAVKKISRNELSPAIDEMDKHIKGLNRSHRAEIKRIQAHYENLLTQSEVRYQHRVATSIGIPKSVRKVAKKVVRRK